MDLKGYYRRFKAWQLKAFDYGFDENEHHHCVNCDNDFVGSHCPYCSQKAGLGKISWKSVLQSTAEVWGLHDRSMLYSLWQLVFRPGYFISDYINGKRQVSFPPVKMLVIMGVVSVVVDQLFAAPDLTREVTEMTRGDSLWVREYFDWLEASPGWGWLSITCFFLIPTWCIFRYSPRNARHSLPQGFFIQVFMSLQVLIVDDLADFFGDFFYIMVPLCYMYTYRQLFGYGFWGTVWRTLLTLASSFMIVLMIMIICDMEKGSETYTNILYQMIGVLFTLSLVMILGSMFLSKNLARRSEK